MSNTVPPTLYVSDILDDGHNCIVDGTNLIYVGTSSPLSQPRNAALAHEIVRRCNNFEQMKAALQTMVVCYANSGGCVRNDAGYCTEHGSLCPINEAVSVLEKAGAK